MQVLYQHKQISNEDNYYKKKPKNNKFDLDMYYDYTVQIKSKLQIWNH